MVLQVRQAVLAVLVVLQVRPLRAVLAVLVVLQVRPLRAVLAVLVVLQVRPLRQACPDPLSFGREGLGRKPVFAKY